MNTDSRPGTTARVVERIIPGEYSRGRMVRAVGLTQTFLSPAEVEQMVALAEKLVELGERLSVHRRTAAAHLVRWSVPIRRRGLDERHLSETVELYGGGLTLMAVGLRFGLSNQAVRRSLAAMGVAIGPSGRRAVEDNAKVPSPDSEPRAVRSPDQVASVKRPLA